MCLTCSSSAVSQRSLAYIGNTGSQHWSDRTFQNIHHRVTHHKSSATMGWSHGSNGQLAISKYDLLLAQETRATQSGATQTAWYGVAWHGTTIIIMIAKRHNLFNIISNICGLFSFVINHFWGIYCMSS